MGIILLLFRMPSFSFNINKADAVRFFCISRKFFIVQFCVVRVWLFCVLFCFILVVVIRPVFIFIVIILLIIMRSNRRTLSSRSLPY